MVQFLKDVWNKIEEFEKNPWVVRAEIAAIVVLLNDLRAYQSNSALVVEFQHVAEAVRVVLGI